LSEVETICSRAIIISGGKLVADSSIEELKEKFGHDISIRITLGKTDFEALSTGLTSLDGVDSLSKTSEYSLDNLELMEVLISVKGDKEIRPQVCRKLQEMNLDLYELCMEKNSLEDVFHALTENPQEAK